MDEIDAVVFCGRLSGYVVCRIGFTFLVDRKVELESLLRSRTNKNPSFRISGS